MSEVLEYKWEGELTYATLTEAFKIKGSLEKVGEKTYRASLHCEKSVPVTVDNDLVPGVELEIYGYVDAGSIEEEFEAESVEHAFVLFGDLVSNAKFYLEDAESN